MELFKKKFIESIFVLGGSGQVSGWTLPWEATHCRVTVTDWMRNLSRKQGRKK